MNRRKVAFAFSFDEANHLETRSLMTMVGPVSLISAASTSQVITFPELDGPGSSIAIRVDETESLANAAKVRSGDTFTLTFPDPTKQYTVVSNKPANVQVVQSGTKVQITALHSGFLGLKIETIDKTQSRYLGLYIADRDTGIVPDEVLDYVPLGTVTSIGETGNSFIEGMNFQPQTAPVDYLYIYDQGGANYRDANLKGLLQQAATYGMVPSVVYYNIQNVSSASGASTGVVEGPGAAFQAINNYDTNGQSLYTDYMKNYFIKLKESLGVIQQSGLPVQIIMEPDFLGYMATGIPSQYGLPSSFVPDATDKTLNTVRVDQIYDSGLLTQGVDPDFPNTVKGFVEAVNYAVAKTAQNVRIGWKTNIWAVADQQNWSLGIMHITDSQRYPWQSQWSGPAASWEEGRNFISAQATGLATFLKNAGTQTWTGISSKQPFIAIDKYGVDGAYLFDPNFLSTSSATAAFGNLTSFVSGAYLNLANISDADTLKYFGLGKSEFSDFYNKYNQNYDKSADDVISVFTTLQNAAKSDYNLAQWFWNSDQWNNYLYFVSQISAGLDGSKVMLWQIPQGHINGSTSGGDLTNTDANYEDSATSYFFGDTFTPNAGGLEHFAENQAQDANLTVSGSTITWGEHMSLAQSSNVLSVLFGAGLGISTRGTPTPAGGVNDNNIFAQKATSYLKSKYNPDSIFNGNGWEVTTDPNTWPSISATNAGELQLVLPSLADAYVKPFKTKVRNLNGYLSDTNQDGVPELIATATVRGIRKIKVYDLNSLKPLPSRLANLVIPHVSLNINVGMQEVVPSNPGKELVIEQIMPRGRILKWIYSQSGRLIARRRQ